VEFLVAALVCSLYAKDNVYIGASYSYDISSYKVGNGQDYKGSSVGTSFSIGKYFDNYRVHMGLQNTNNIGAGVDYMIQLNNSDITPYIGTALYYYYSKDKYTGTTTTYTGQSVHAWTPSLTAGFIYPLNDKFEFESSISIGKSFVSPYQDVTYKSIAGGKVYF